MNLVLVGLGAILSLGALYFQIVILIAAFKDEVWKGLLSLFCGLYFIYYALTEFDHPDRTKIILGALVPGIIGYILMALGAPHNAPQSTY